MTPPSTPSTPITRDSFAVGQQWRTRNGEVVRVTKVDPGDDLPVCTDKGYWHRTDGTSCINCSDDDLIELVSGPAPTPPSTKSQPMNAQEVISGLILNAARAAVPADAEQLMLLPDCGPRNKRLMPLLIGLVEALKVTAQAAADNALDERYPVDAQLVVELSLSIDLARQALQYATAPRKP